MVAVQHMMSGIRLVRRLMLGGAALALVASIGPNAWSGLQLYWHRNDPIRVVTHHVAAVTYSGYEAEIRLALKAPDAELARSLADVALQHGHVIDPELLADISEAEQFSLSRSAGEIYDGVVFGKTDTVIGFSSSVLADQLVIGDIRDLGTEAFRYPDQDNVTVALASAGIAASAATIVSGPGARIGVSFIKALKKAGTLPPRIVGQLGQLGTEILDVRAARDVLRQASLTNWRRTVDDLVRLFRKDKLAVLVSTADSTGGLLGAQGFRATSDTIKRINALDELPAYRRLADDLGPHYRGSLKLYRRASLGIGLGEILIGTLWAVLNSIWFVLSLALAVLQFALKPLSRLAFRLARKEH